MGRFATKSPNMIPAELWGETMSVWTCWTNGSTDGEVDYAERVFWEVSMDVLILFSWPWLWLSFGIHCNRHKSEFTTTTVLGEGARYKPFKPTDREYLILEIDFVMQFNTSNSNLLLLMKNSLEPWETPNHWSETIEFLHGGKSVCISAVSLAGCAVWHRGGVGVINCQESRWKRRLK